MKTAFRPRIRIILVPSSDHTYWHNRVVSPLRVPLICLHCWFDCKPISIRLTLPINSVSFRAPPPPPKCLRNILKQPHFAILFSFFRSPSTVSPYRHICTPISLFQASTIKFCPPHGGHLTETRRHFPNITATPVTLLTTLLSSPSFHYHTSRWTPPDAASLPFSDTLRKRIFLVHRVHTLYKSLFVYSIVIGNTTSMFPPKPP